MIEEKSNIIFDHIIAPIKYIWRNQPSNRSNKTLLVWSPNRREFKIKSKSLINRWNNIIKLQYKPIKRNKANPQRKPTRTRPRNKLRRRNKQRGALTCKIIIIKRHLAHLPQLLDNILQNNTLLLTKNIPKKINNKSMWHQIKQLLKA